MSFGYIPAGGGGAAELPADLEARLLPTGGEDGQIVVYSDDPDQQGAWGDLPPMTKFRGVWGPDELVTQFDFGNGLTSMLAAGGNAPTPPSVSVVGMASLGGTSKPPFGQALVVSTTSGSSNAKSWAEMDMGSILAMQGKTLTRVKFYDSVYHKTTANNALAQFTENGITKVAVPAGTSNAYDAWTLREVALSGGPKIGFQITNASSSVTGNQYLIAGLELYAAVLPYMAGDVVTHGGVLWKSKVNNNSATPQAGSAYWTQL